MNVFIRQLNDFEIDGKKFNSLVAAFAEATDPQELENAILRFEAEILQRAAGAESLGSLRADLETAVDRVATLQAELVQNEALQVGLVDAARQAASARDWPAIDAIVVQASETPSVVRDRQVKQARVADLEQKANAALAEVAAARAALAEA